MMLDWFDRPATRRAAGVIRGAVSRVFSNRAARTRDMGGTMPAHEMTAAIIEAMPAVMESGADA
jgi:isocitrate/isopropylmalate dehydrogenase